MIKIMNYNTSDLLEEYLAVKCSFLTVGIGMPFQKHWIDLSQEKCKPNVCYYKWSSCFGQRGSSVASLLTLSAVLGGGRLMQFWLPKSNDTDYKNMTLPNWFQKIKKLVFHSAYGCCRRGGHIKRSSALTATDGFIIGREFPLLELWLG